MEGEAVTLSVSVNGATPFTYQWYKAGVALSGAVSSTLTFPVVLKEDDGSYTVRVGNGEGSIESGPVLLAVTPASVPSVSLGGFSNALIEGDSLSLYAYTSGTPPYTYVWKRGSTVLATTSQSSYSKSNVTQADAGIYSVTVTNVAGSANSLPVTVTVSPMQPPTVSLPSAVSATVGNTLSIYASVGGRGPYTYRWRKGAVDIPGATSSNLYISNAQLSDSGVYSVIVTNPVGSATSNAALATVSVAQVDPPAIYSGLSAISVLVGQPLNLSVFTSGLGTLSYQWRKDGQDIPGATSSSYTKSQVQIGDVGIYSVAVSNAGGVSTANIVALSVANVTLPVIRTHPRSVALFEGSSFWGFNVAVESSSGLTYQWRKDGVVLPNSNSSTLNMSMVSPSNEGVYSVVVSNSAGSVTSENATLQILPPQLPIFNYASPDMVVAQGAVATMRVGIDTSTVPPGTGPTIKWQKDGVDIPGTNNPEWSLVVASSDAGVYQAVATNAVGSVTSPPITLGVRQSSAPRILGVSQHLSLLPGTSFSVYAQVESIAPVSYQWHRNNVPIAGATTDTYRGTGQPVEAGAYKLVVTNALGSSTTRDIMITIDSVASRPPIVSTDGSRMVRGGESAWISVGLLNSSDAVQWQKDGVDIPNATSASYNIASFAPGSAGSYAARVTRSGSAPLVSQPIVLELRDAGQAPLIIVQPRWQPSEMYSFSLYIGVIGEEPLTYRWKKDNVLIPNATSASYFGGGLSSASDGRYHVEVTNRHGTVSSQPVDVVYGANAPKPIFSQQPVSLNIAQGASAQLTLGLLNGSAGVSFQWYKDAVAIPSATDPYYTIQGNSIGAGRYHVVATSQAGQTASDVANVTVTSPQSNPVFSGSPQSQTRAVGQSVTFTTSATSATTISYQWRRNGVPIPGATQQTLTIAVLDVSDAGVYTLLASNAVGTSTSNPATLTLTERPPLAIGVYAGTYIAALPGAEGIWGMQVNLDRTAVFVALFTGRNEVFVRKLSISTSGGFQEGGIRGQFSTSELRMSFDDGRVAPFGDYRVVPASTHFIAPTGYFTAPHVASSAGEVHVITAQDGRMLLVAKDAAGARGGIGRVSETGEFSYVGPSYSYQGRVSDGRLQGSYLPQGGAAVSYKSSAAGRLFNISTRGVSRGGDGLLIAGFVVTGTEPKNVLIRGVGPNLSELGVSGVLPNPHLRVVNQGNGQTVAENDDWEQNGRASQVMTSAGRTGAYPFKPGSKDAALVLRLDPGIYTAQLSTNGSGDGIALVEVYDDSTVNPYAAKMINLSTRGDVGRGDDILILGLNVAGSGSRKLLIRGVGPGLKEQSVAGFLADPKIELYKGQTKLMENDNWGDTADSAAIASAAGQVGAFALANGSKDAAMLVYLAPESEAVPGAYTVVVQGVNNTTGIALVEVYEVP